MPKKEESYTKIPDIILDNKDLNVYEFRILMHIARQTIGYGKKSDGISLSQFVKATGVSDRKVQTTIKELKEKKYIRVTQQMKKGKGKSFNRYTLTLRHSVPNLPHDMPNPTAHDAVPLRHVMPIQKKIEQKKIDKREERDITSNNIYFSLLGNELKKEIHRFTEEQSTEANNRSAYKAKLKRQLEKNHQETLANFEEWYLNEKCSELTGEYQGKYFKDATITSIHSYLDTDGFDDSAKFILQTESEDKQVKTEIYHAYEDIADDLKEFASDADKE